MKEGIEQNIIVIWFFVIIELDITQIEFFFLKIKLFYKSKV